MIRFRFVEEHRNAHGVKRMCDVLGWDRSGYYTWHKNKETRQQRVDEEEGMWRQIREIHTDSRGAYGALRITRALRVQGHVVNRKRVARVMRERQIAGTTRRKSRSLTKPDRTASPAPDLIQRDFTAPMPGLKLVGDITCLPTAEGWLYLATVIDLCTREVVGWSMADHMRTQLVDDAIRMAHVGGHTAGNAIFHTDRGSQGGLNWSSQHLVISEVWDGSSSAGGRSGGAPEVEVTGASEISASYRGGVLGRNRQGASRGGSGRGYRCGAGGGHALVPAMWRHATVRSAAAFGQVPVVF
ncbi:IS3 family transposase [Streptomyces sp. STR69]|uniref:IS3 family transposase n=1 Tax=Streptomyces sp. STR69 TaxID=1796942 RepID=UPI0021CABDD8|nr:IS3 family transposase [Streptomyces sp. STR69]